MTNQQLVKELDRILSEHSILKHPFYQKWNEGKLTIDELRYYAVQYNYFVENFPMFVSSVHSNCDNKNIRKMLVENIADEDGYKTGVADHPMLWRQFAHSLGVSDNEMNNTMICDEVKQSVAEFYSLCRSKNYVSGLAALYAYESQIPEVSKVKIEGLKKFYNISDEKAVEFFSVHHEADVHHSKCELDAILSACNTDDDREAVIEAAEKSAKLYWQMLDGVYVN